MSSSQLTFIFFRGVAQPPSSQHGVAPLRRIDEITFPAASQGGRRVCFVTERCVMELRNQRLVLTELANGMSRSAGVLESP